MIYQDLFTKSETIEFGLGFGIEGVHQEAARGLGFIFLFAADSGVGKVYFVPKLFGGHPFGSVANDGKLLGAIAGGDNKALIKFSQVLTEVGAGFFDKRVGGFVGTSVMNSEEVGDNFFVGGGIAILGIKDELGVVGVVGRKSGEMVNEGAPCFFESSPIAYFFEVVPSSDNVIAVDEEYGFGSGGRFHGLRDRLKVMALSVMIGNRPYNDTVACMLSHFFLVIVMWDGFLGVGVFAIAVLYGAVGHGGASGYIAVMTLCDVAPTEIKPIALVLNIGVAGLGAWQFWRSGVMSWRLLGQASVLAVPMAFLGGYVRLPIPVLKALLGLVLCLSAVRFWVKPREEKDPQSPSLPIMVLSGGAIGGVAGLTGTGGGIFLTPLMLELNWARTKTVSAVSAGFIFLNSIAGLMGSWRSGVMLPGMTGGLLAAAMLGGAIGSYWGAWRLSNLAIKRVLGGVLAIAGMKLLLG